MKCPTCGAENDPANRFCEQCGAGLQSPAVEAAATAVPVATACPQCGAVVLPGEAFCDNCGASLAGLVPVEAAVSPPELAPTLMPDPAPVAQPEPAMPDAPTLPPEPAPEAAPVPAQEPAPEPAPEAAPAPEEAPVAPPPEEAVLHPTVIDSAPTVEAPAQGAVAPDAQAAFDASKQELETEIAKQQQVVVQLEGVQSMLGAATPAGVLQSLDEARAALAKVQDELMHLAPPAPAVDPAIVAALQDELAKQQQVVTQLSGVQSMLGAATPAGVLQSLADAQAALQTAQDELAALGVGPAAPASAAVPATAAPATTEAPISPDAPTMVAPPAVAPAIPATPAAQEAPAAMPAPAGPRLVFDDGSQDITLPAGKSEITIGREDPISGIYPEVDLTPHGGEGGGVSRQHARLNLSSGQWTLMDLNSTNHTKIDGARLEPNVPTPVHDGARLQFGRLSMVLRLS